MAVVGFQSVLVLLVQVTKVRMYDVRDVLQNHRNCIFAHTSSHEFELVVPGPEERLGDALLLYEEAVVE